MLTPLMDELRACLCAALENTVGGAATCACILIPGLRAPADWCGCNGASGCGQAWVRLDSVFPAGQNFPSPDAASGNCANVLAAILEVGVYRCQPMPKAQGTPPDPADVTQAAIIAAGDAIAMAQAINCCTGITKRKHVMGRYSPRSSGGCGGGVWPVTVQLTRR